MLTKEKEVSVGTPEWSAFGRALSTAFVNALDEAGERTSTSVVRLRADTERGSREETEADRRWFEYFSWNNGCRRQIFFFKGKERNIFIFST